ncbi:Uncharacterised protein [Mycobacteroides abscessus subsp. massiliense]|nr:Uncharacterised protein [Mycobacteroides abscessus subsp. massiliense]SKL18907.1 Uncharacterised protein [Mycobacteroides abscessus subsp. massiliense]SLE92391.1 Uncharacterised protein [Mycobacteroides abscessus subsp. massiliense]
MAAMVTGSDPLSRPATLDRSQASPAGGSPRWAASSNAKLGAAANTRPYADSVASCLIQRRGRRTNASGDIKVMCPPHSGGNRIMIRPMS